MALQSFNLIPRRTKKTHKIKGGEFTVMIPDATFLSETVQIIAATEIKKQIAIGNDPYNIIVDNVSSKPITQAKARVLTLFSDPKIIAIGTLAVLRELKSVTKYDKGTARKSFQIWVAESKDDPGRMVKKNGSQVSFATVMKLAEGLGPEGRIIVVGPMVDYGRKLYHRPQSKRRLRGRARSDTVYDSVTGKISKIKHGVRDTNMRDLVVGRLKRKYKNLFIVGQWVGERMINGSNRWPGIAIGLKSKGRVKGR